jgi:cytochrome c oxidase subunit 2
MEVVRYVATRRGTLWSALTALAVALLLAPAALAEEPQDWQIGMQPGVTPVRAQIDSLHDYFLLPVSGVICVLVLGLLLWVILFYNAKRHPTPSATTHNPVLEVFWTVVPALVLIVIAFPSFRLLYYVDHTEKADMTLKVTGHQWYWSYEYPDQGALAFDSYMLPEDKLQPGQKRLLDVDNPVVVPVGATVRLLITGTDVIHSWFVPAVGVQEYAIVGRNNESWMRIDKPGIYYGQCNQICGVNHPFMPIAIKAVSQDEFKAWLIEAKKNALNGGGTFRLAAAAPR